MEKVKFDFEGQVFEMTVLPDVKRCWSMTVEQVAEGYGVSRVTVQRHLTNHSTELRESIEKGVQIVNTLGGPQEKIVIYRDGVIKLGFFIKSKRAAAFRQWATDVLVEALEKHGVASDNHMSALLNSFNEFRKETADNFQHWANVTKGLRSDLEEIQAILGLFVSGKDAAQIQNLMAQVKAKTGMDGRKIVGMIKKDLDTHRIYDSVNPRLVINWLKRQLGEGLALVAAQQP